MCVSPRRNGKLDFEGRVAGRAFAECVKEDDGKRFAELLASGEFLDFANYSAGMWLREMATKNCVRMFEEALRSPPAPLSDGRLWNSLLVALLAGSRDFALLASNVVPARKMVEQGVSSGALGLGVVLPQIGANIPLTCLEWSCELGFRRLTRSILSNAKRAGIEWGGHVIALSPAGMSELSLSEAELLCPSKVALAGCVRAGEAV